MEWQPIETAPKDRVILVWSLMHGGKWFLAHWDNEKHSRNPKPYWKFSDELLWGVRAVRANQPIFWMPLPEPPK